MWSLKLELKPRWDKTFEIWRSEVVHWRQTMHLCDATSMPDVSQPFLSTQKVSKTSWGNSKHSFADALVLLKHLTARVEKVFPNLGRDPAGSRACQTCTHHLFTPPVVFFLSLVLWGMSLEGEDTDSRRGRGAQVFGSWKGLTLMEGRKRDWWEEEFSHELFMMYTRWDFQRFHWCLKKLRPPHRILLVAPQMLLYALMTPVNMWWIELFGLSWCPLPPTSYLIREDTDHCFCCR